MKNVIRKAYPIKKNGGNDVRSGELKAGRNYKAVFDGANFVLVKKLKDE